MYTFFSLQVIHTLISLDKVLKGEKDDELYISTNSLNSSTNKLPKKKNSSNSKHVSTIEIYEQAQHRIHGSRVSPVEDNEVEQYVIIFLNKKKIIIIYTIKGKK